MISVVISIHIIVCISMCIIILLQQGKGADIGARPAELLQRRKSARTGATGPPKTEIAIAAGIIARFIGVKSAAVTVFGNLRTAQPAATSE